MAKWERRSDTYLIHVCRLPRRIESVERIDKKTELMPPLWLSSAVEAPFQLIEVTLLTESSVFFKFFFRIFTPQGMSADMSPLFSIIHLEKLSQ